MESFRVRLRRVGNSVGLLIPKDKLDEIHAKEGDEVEVVVHRTAEQRRKALDALIGSASGLPHEPFRRERNDRY